MDGYRAFLCVLLLLAVIAFGWSFRASLKTRETEFGDPSDTIRESERPLHFWTEITYRLVLAILVITVLLIAIIRGRIPN